MAVTLPSCSQSDEAELEDRLPQLYGNVDIREVNLAFQDGGRITNIFVEEGEQITKGGLVAELDAIRFTLEVQRISAEINAQRERVTILKKGSREQDIKAAKASVAAAQAELEYARKEYARKKSLKTSIRISQQEVDNALTREKSAKAALKVAEEKLSLVIAGPRKEEIAEAEAGLSALQAALDLAKQRVTDSKLYAPADGIIRNRILEPGAMATTGTPVVTLALINPLWIRAYVNEPDLGRVREGMKAAITTDSYPGKEYTGWVGYISPTAEFTPKTVETSELRTKLVYRARIFVCNADNELRLGMPVTVHLSKEMLTKTNSSDPCGKEQ